MFYFFIDNMPICKKCKLEKEQTEFYKHPQTLSGYLNFCKDCKRGYAKQNRSAEKDRIRHWSSPKRRLYCIFRGMMKRCYDINNKQYKSYGIRGICVLWKDYKEFQKDMLSGYLEHIKKEGIHNTTIDRINNDGHYCKENCRWATYKVQNNNRRDNNIIEYNGEIDTLANMCRKYGVNEQLVRGRIYKGRPIDKAFIHPLVQSGHRTF